MSNQPKALDHFSSIDRQLAEMKDEFEAERKLLQDQLFAARTEAHLSRELLIVATEARSLAEQRCTKLLTQFGTVAMIFEEAKQLAEEITRAQIPPQGAETALKMALTPSNRKNYAQEPDRQEERNTDLPEQGADGDQEEGVRYQQPSQASRTLGASMVPFGPDGQRRLAKTRGL